MTLISHCLLFEVPEKAKFRVAVSDARAPMSINTIDSLNLNVQAIRGSYQEQVKLTVLASVLAAYGWNVCRCCALEKRWCENVYEKHLTLCS